MVRADWGQNTDFRAVFVDLLLPLAKKNKVKPEDMIKRLFVVSDMQFDVSRDSQQQKKGKRMKSWETTYDFIEKAYAKAGYEIPQIVFYYFTDISPQHRHRLKRGAGTWTRQGKEK